MNLSQSQNVTEAQYRSLVQNLPIGVYRNLPGSAGKFIVANPAFLNMFGLESEAELQYFSPSDFYINPAERETFSDNLLSQGRVSGIEFHLKKKDGTPIWGSITARVIRDDFSGEVAFFDCAIEDITDRKRAEDELLQRAQELATLHAVSLDITTPDKLPGLLQTIVERATRLLNANGTNLYLCNAELQEVYLAAQYSSSQQKHTRVVLRYGEGAAGRVAQNGQALIIDDYRTWEGRSATYESEQPNTAMLSVPMIWQGKTIGVIQVLDNVQFRQFINPNLDLLSLFANQAAISIVNTRLYEAERRQRQEAETLREAAQAVSESLEPTQVLRVILDQLKRVLTFDTASVLLLQDKDKPAFVVGLGYQDENLTSQSARNMLKDSPILSQMVQDLQPVVISDVRLHPGWKWVAGAEHVRSFMAVPIIFRQMMIGALMADNSQTNYFNTDDVRTVQSLAQHMAIAIKNADLFKAEEKRSTQLEFLRQASLSLTASLNLDAVLNAILRSVIGLLPGVRDAHIFLYFPDRDGSLEFGAALWADGQRDVPYAKPRPDGLTYTVARQGEPILVADISVDPIFKNTPQEWSGSIIGLPLKIGSRVVGVMNVAHAEAGAFSQDDLSILGLLGDQAAIAIENARLYQQIQLLTASLISQQKRLENLVEHLPVGVLLLNANYDILAINPVGREIALAIKLISQDGLQIAPDLTTLRDLLARHREPWPVEIGFDGPPKRIFEAQARSVGELHNEGERQWVLMVREITQERDNQLRIQMQERLATVGQLAAGIAHDFNNIMAAIMVYTDLLLGDLDLRSASRDRLKIIYDQVQRAASLIRQILDFSRRSVLEQSTLDLLPFIKELDKLLVRILPETIRLELVYQAGTYLVHADPTSLQQVFMNLAVNSRDAMPAGGVLTFKLGCLHIDQDERPPLSDLHPGDWILVSVKDTGEGIPPDVIPHIFEPFFTTKPVGSGTGLGLSQVYGIISQHDGHIDVKSRVGEGTEFCLYLPALPVPINELFVPENNLDMDGGGRTILLVEDDPVTRQAMQVLLEVQNYHVLSASNGLEALQSYEHTYDRIALVISDVVMPRMGGVTLYHTIREKWSNVKMLFITGHPLENENQALLEGGHVRWLQKPFSVTDLNKAIKYLLEL